MFPNLQTVYTVTTIDFDKPTANLDATLILAATRVILDTPLHCLTASIIGINLSKRFLLNSDISFFGIVLVPVCFHAGFNLQLMVIPLFFNMFDKMDADNMIITALIIELVVCIIYLTFMFLYARRHLRKADEEMDQNAAHAEAAPAFTVV